MMSSIKDLNHWTSATKGLLRYPLAANACYEIFITKIDYTAIKNAGILCKDYEILMFPKSYHYIDCNVYVSGEWINDKTRNLSFTRIPLVNKVTLNQALDLIYEDYKEN